MLVYIVRDVLVGRFSDQNTSLVLVCGNTGPQHRAGSGNCVQRKLSTVTIPVPLANTVAPPDRRRGAMILAVAGIVRDEVTNNAAVAGTVREDVTSSAALLEEIVREDVTSSAAVAGTNREVESNEAVAGTVREDVTNSAAVAGTVRDDVTSSAALFEEMVREEVTNNAAVDGTVRLDVTSSAAVAGTVRDEVVADGAYPGVVNAKFDASPCVALVVTTFLMPWPVHVPPETGCTKKSI